MTTKTTHARQDAAEMTLDREDIDQLNRQAWTLKTIQTERAEKLAREAIRQSTMCGYDEGVAHGQVVLAFIDMLQAHYADGELKAEGALKTFEEKKDRQGEAAAHFVLGVICRWTRDPHDAVEHYNRSLAIAREIGDHGIEAVALNGMGNALRHLGEWDSALEHYQQGLEIAVAEGLREAEGTVLVNIGGTYMQRSEYDTALDYLNRSLEIARAISDDRLVMSAVGNIAIVYRTRGDLSTALNYQIDHLHRAEQLDDPMGIYSALASIGEIYLDLGEYQCALDSLLRALDICETIGYKQGEAGGLLDIGRLYERFGENPLALDYYFRSLQLSQEIGDFLGQSFAHYYLGRFYQNIGDKARALAYYLKCLRMQEKNGYRHGLQTVIMAIGNLYGSLGEHVEARRFLDQSLELARAIGDPSSEISSFISLARLEAELSHHTIAIEHLNLALQKARPSRFLDHCRHAAEELAKIHRLLGNTQLATRYEHEHQRYTQMIFNDETTRRSRDLIGKFEENAAYREGERLGLEESDLARIRAATQKIDLQLVRSPADTTSTGAQPKSDLQIQRVNSGESEPAIRVRTFGGFSVFLHGRELQRGDWTRKRVRDLFKLLLVNHRTALTVDEIHEKLWGERSDRNIEMLVMNAASHIRKAFEPEPGGHRSSFSLVCRDGAYTLDLGPDASIDFLKFKELIVAARRSNTTDERSRFYSEAVELYSGDFLQEDAFTEWTEYHRQILKDAFLEGLEYLTREYLRTGRVEEAIETARQILLHDNTSETAYYVLLLSLKKCGRIGEARRLFAECTETFKHELGSIPPERLRQILD